jgi:2-dehydro-3-deoxygalactonokinase
MTVMRILGDWGTTRLRLFRQSAQGAIERIEGPGIGTLDVPPARALLDILVPWRSDGQAICVTLCGMAGARGGLIEAVYVDCPATPADWNARHTRTVIDGIDIAVMPGLRHRDERGVPDVMRGEETQIFGALALDPSLGEGEHVFLLPGTHSKWAAVRDGRVQAFRTFPIGEIYALLTERSTIGTGAPGHEGSFAEGFARGMERSQEPLTAALFEARAARLLDDRSLDWSRGYLSGLLIGQEVRAQATTGAGVILVGDPALCAHYERALDGIGYDHRRMDGDAAVLAGLRSAQGDM